jgi:hypothetical protein
MDGQGVGTTSSRRRRTLLVFQLPLLELLVQEASDHLTGRRFALHTFDPKPMPELLIKVERNFLTFPLCCFDQISCWFPRNTRLCTKSRFLIGFFGIKTGLFGREKAFTMRPKRSY